MQPFETGFFHLASRFWDSSVLLGVSVVHSFLLQSGIPLQVSFIHSPTERYLDGFSVFWAIINKATVNICIQLFLWI